MTPKSLSEIEAELTSALKKARARSASVVEAVRYVGDAVLQIQYRGRRKDRKTHSPRPAYDIVIKIGRFRHKLTVGGPAEWSDNKATQEKSFDDIAASAIALVLNDAKPDSATRAVFVAAEPALSKSGEVRVSRSKER